MKINNYKEYLAQISEGLNSPATVNWIIQQPDKWYGEFTVGKHKFQIYIDNYSKIEKHFLFKFKGDFKFNLINDVKAAMTTIPTIENAAIYFIKQMKPNAFIFCSTDDSISREVMYDRFSHKIEKQFKFKYEKHNMLNNLIFYVLLKNCDVQELNKSLIKIVKKVAGSGMK